MPCHFHAKCKGNSNPYSKAIVAPLDLLSQALSVPIDTLYLLEGENEFISSVEKC